MTKPDWRLIFGIGLTALLALGALTSFVWTPYDPMLIDLTHRLQAPSWPHLLGTDRFGRDVLSLLMWGGRNTLFVALSSVAIGLIFGLPVGLWAGIRGGMVDALLMRGSDVVFAFPAVLTALLLAAALGPGADNIILAMGVFNIPVFAKTARGLAMVQWQLPYVAAARVAGKSAAAISVEHVLPNISAGFGAQAAVQFATAIIAEAGLSYIGLGVQPPEPSWGRLLAEAQTLIETAPYLAIFPGMAIALAVLGFNLLGEWASERFATQREL